MEPHQLPTPVESRTLSTYFANGQETTSRLLDELVALISEFGNGGGSLTPSIYDTAQVLRFAPPEETPHLALDWLVSNQDQDGGWGNLYSQEPVELARFLLLQFAQTMRNIY